MLNLVWRLEEEQQRYQRLQEEHPGAPSVQAKLAEFEDLPALLEQMPARSILEEEGKQRVLEQVREVQEEQNRVQETP